MDRNSIIQDVLNIIPKVIVKLIMSYDYNFEGKFIKRFKSDVSILQAFKLDGDYIATTSCWNLCINIWNIKTETKVCTLNLNKLPSLNIISYMITKIGEIVVNYQTKIMIWSVKENLWEINPVKSSTFKINNDIVEILSESETEIKLLIINKSFGKITILIYSRFDDNFFIERTFSNTISINMGSVFGNNKFLIYYDDGNMEIFEEDFAYKIPFVGKDSICDHITKSHNGLFLHMISKKI